MSLFTPSTLFLVCRSSLRRSWVFAGVLLYFFSLASALRAASTVPTFATPVPITVPGLNSTLYGGAGAATLKVVDMNGDGKPDVVVTTQAGTISIFLGDGKGNFSVAATYTFGSVDATQRATLAVFDMDGDGKPDVAVLDAPNKRILIYKGNGDGTLQAPTALTIPNASPVEMVSGDFDGDGKTDLIVGDGANKAVYLLSGNGAGGFSTPKSYQTTGTTYENTFSAVDFNGDGVTDFGGVTGTVYNTISGLNAGGTITSLPLYNGYPLIFSAAAGNLTGTGKGSLAVGTESQVVIYPTPSSSTTSAVGYSVAGNVDAIAFADLNGDGKMDVITGNDQPHDGVISILMGNGDGTLQPAQNIYLSNIKIPDAVVVADVNGDGYPDIIFTDNWNYFWVMLQVAPLAITSANSATFQAGSSGSFTVTATGVPAPTFTESGTLPAGVTFSAGGVFSGTPAPGSSGAYSLVITASNGSQTTVTQNFTLTVNPAPIPTLTATPTYFGVTSNSASLQGSVTSDGGYALTKRGVLYAPTSINAAPTLGGTGVLENDDTLTDVGSFSRLVTNLNAQTNYSFVVFATNNQGTGYSPVATFQTLPPPGAGSLVVTTLVDEDNGTSDPSQGTGTSLREAINYANQLGGNLTITFSPNLFVNGPATITLTDGTIGLGNLYGTTTIAGPGAGQLTISGNGNTQIFSQFSGNAQFNGLTLAHGYARLNGGAFVNYGGLSAYDCVFTQNVSEFDGGALYSEGSFTLWRCTFTGNSVTSGSGGALCNTAGQAFIYNSTFCGNSSKYNGKGLGGAVCNSYSGPFMIMINSTITGNSADGGGGGFENINGRADVINCIICGNTAPANTNVSGTLYPYYSSNNLQDIDPTTIFATGTPAYNDGGTTPTIALMPGGPAVNAGSTLAVDYSNVAIATDQTGRPRIIGSTVDIGAYEEPLPPTLAASTVTVTATTATVGGNVTSNGYGTISRQGVVYALNSQNGNPTIGGTGVSEVDTADGTGAFSVLLSKLTPLTTYSFATFATNEAGTTYSAVQTFETTETPSLVVTTTSDTLNPYDNQTSLREAVAYANSIGTPVTITFAPALAGQTVTLSTGWNNASDTVALRVTGQVTIQGPATAPGVTITIAPGVQMKHIEVENGASLIVTNLTFTNGYSDFGGSMRDFGSLTIRGCTFTGNHATTDSGAVNTASGAAYLLIENSTFSGNVSDGVAGAVGASALQSTLHDLTITGNTSSSGGGALLAYAYPVTLMNSIVAGNTNDGILLEGGGTISGQSTNNIIGSGGSGGLTNGVNENYVGVPTANLYLGALGQNGGPTPTVALLPGSVAIDAGTPISGITFDQRGFVRTIGTAPDIGAYEENPTAATAPLITPNSGTYGGSVSVSMSTSSTPASIYYTLDGSTPSASHGTLYNGSFKLTSSATVLAVATGPGWLDSTVSSTNYTVETSLQAWRALQTLAADGSQDLANPSGDGIGNLLKFAFNMAPNAGGLSLANRGVLGTTGTAGLPNISVDAQDHLVIQFLRRSATSNSGVSYIVETGAGLTQFQALDLSNATVTSIDGTWERVSITDPVITSKRFGRVRVSAP